MPGDLFSMTGVFNYQDSELILFVDGEEQTRTLNFQTPGMTSDTSSLNIRVGADAAIDQPRGFFSGRIAELIVYNRALNDIERLQVEEYLFEKWMAPVPCAPANALLGDLDGDGSVSFPDFLTMAANFGSDVDSYGEGDVNCDGAVEFDDFLALAANFGQSIVATESESPVAAIVPEPSTAIVGFIAFTSFALISRRREFNDRRSHYISSVSVTDSSKERRKNGKTSFGLFQTVNALTIWRVSRDVDR